jgi:cell division protein FtsW (lipid II flippase)
MPLPFISYGGSNLLLMLVSVGLLLSISRFAAGPIAVNSGPARDAQELTDD